MKCLLLFCGLLSLQSTAFATIRYVKQGGTGTQTGANWANASGDVQLMINQSSTTVVDTIYLAAGTYLPNRPANNLNTIDATNRNNAFTFTKNVRIFGGFPNTGNPGWAARNWRTNVSRLSGNIGNAGSADNCYHVVATLGSTVTANFIMDGVTVSDGNAIVATSIIVNGITLGERLGAGWNNSGGSPTLRNLIFENNAISQGSGYGVAFYNEGSPTVTNTLFRNNNATSSRGGAWYNQSGNPILTNVLMQGNATNAGGGGYSADGVVTLNNATIVGNSAFTGGGWYMEDGDIIINNSIIYHNTASNDAGVAVQFFAPLLTPTASYNYSLVQGLAGGSNGNLNGNVINPGFIAPVAGTSAPTAAGDYNLLSTSPCINAGSNTFVPSGTLSDLGGFGRIASGTVDMGVYEFGSTPLPVSITHFSLRADGCTIALTWTGQNESRLQHYLIESSVDGASFLSAGSVEAHNQNRANYTFSLEQNTPHAYYRLKALNQDGGFNYSPILQSFTNCKAAQGAVLSPNPVSDVLLIKGLQEGQSVRVYNLQGKMLANQIAKRSSLHLDVQHYNSGLYTAVIYSAIGEVIATHKFVVN